MRVWTNEKILVWQNLWLPSDRPGYQQRWKIIHGHSRYGAVIGVFAESHPVVVKFITALASGGDIGMAYLIKITNQTITELGEIGHDHKEGEADLLSSLLAQLERIRKASR